MEDGNLLKEKPKSWLWYVWHNMYLPLTIAIIIFCVILATLGMNIGVLIGSYVFFAIILFVIAYFGMYKAYKRYYNYIINK